MTPNGLVEVTEFDTKDGIYDCAWSEVGHSDEWSMDGLWYLSAVQSMRKSAMTLGHLWPLGAACMPRPELTGVPVRQENENILVSSCGDGSIKVWDVAAPPQANPLRSFQEHAREVRYASFPPVIMHACPGAESAALQTSPLRAVLVAVSQCKH